jgi:hypothetical protein
MRRCKGPRGRSRAPAQAPPARHRNYDRRRLGRNSAVFVSATDRDAATARLTLHHRGVAIRVDSPGIDPHRRRTVRAGLGVHLAGALVSPFRCSILPPIHATHIGQHGLTVEAQPGRRSTKDRLDLGGRQRGGRTKRPARRRPRCDNRRGLLVRLELTALVEPYHSTLRTTIHRVNGPNAPYDTQRGPDSKQAQWEP